ncbi:MAG: DUF501 domain-containing protein [Coriobacteriia bacterium]|nr:DUF501 domain-containing protein [Coriobacteriia bacterium]
MITDNEVVLLQLGREPRGTWRSVVRCRHAAPVVIATRPDLEDGEPFPTLFWLTCPVLCERVSALESSGATDAWTDRLASDVDLAAAMGAADEVYRRLRQAEAEGADRCSTVGIAGQRDPLKVKCLHAHVAAYLAGIADPVGQGALEGVPWECDDARCVRGGSV